MLKYAAWKRGRIVAPRPRKLLLYFAVRNLGAIGAAGAFMPVCVCDSGSVSHRTGRYFAT
jgi:hypothetical protein